MNRWHNFATGQRVLQSSFYYHGLNNIQYCKISPLPKNTIQ